MAPNGAGWEFETYSVSRDYETKKTTGAPAPAAPASLAPMLGTLFDEIKSSNYVFANSHRFWAPDPLTLIEWKNCHFLAVTENHWSLKLVLESMTTPIRIPKIK